MGGFTCRHAAAHTNGWNARIEQRCTIGICCILLDLRIAVGENLLSLNHRKAHGKPRGNMLRQRHDMLCRPLPHHRSMMRTDRIEREIDEQIETITANELRCFFRRTAADFAQLCLLRKGRSIPTDARMIGINFIAKGIVRCEEHGQQLTQSPFTKIGGEIAQPNLLHLTVFYRLCLLLFLLFHHSPCPTFLNAMI